MKTRIGLLLTLASALLAPPATLIIAQQAGIGRTPPRPEGPCDIYAAGGAPCVAAHSTTRALYAAYDGPLYQVIRQSDGKTMDIGVVPASPGDPGGYADAAKQDEFCANTYCSVSVLYDQSGKKNHLRQAPRGGTGSPTQMGGFNSLPLADMAPVTLMGHKVYGLFIEPGMGLRLNDTHGVAVDDQAEGQYWVIDGHHYNGGCCFDYGNAETDSRDDGNGTMETTYFGNSRGWYYGSGQGPWVMTDQENNLVGCVNPDGSKYCADLPSVSWRFITAMADGEPHHWRSMGGDAQQGELKVMFDGPRVNNTYDPMRKQGAILLGNGGDNSNGSQGTFYEGALTAPNTFPSKETNQKLQANIVAAHYGVQRLMLAPASAGATPPGLQTFSPGSSQETVVTFTNSSGTPATGVKLGITAPAGWNVVVSGSTDTTRSFGEPVAPGASVSATFKVTAGTAAFNGDLVATASWMAGDRPQNETASEKVRNVSPITINEFAVGSAAFVELYNGGTSEADLSNWTLTLRGAQQAIFAPVKIPAGTRLPPKGFYLLGLANSGLAVPAKKGDTVLHVRSTAGMTAGDTIQIDAGAGAETRKIASVGTAAGFGTTLWQPLPEGPVITVPAGSKSVPVASVNGFEAGQKMGIGYGATYPVTGAAQEQYEVVTVAEVGKPGAQTYLAADAKAGDTAIRVRNAASITAGDTLRLDIDSLGHGIETVTVARVTTQQPPAPSSGPAAGAPAGPGGFGRGRGPAAPSIVELAAPLKFPHASNMPISVHGTGIAFQPPALFAHSSNEPVVPLGTGITLDSPLSNDHPIFTQVRDAAASAEGYQGPPAPNQWFGGPGLANSGSMVLRDAAGLVVDSLNYGGLVDPWAGEGYQGRSPGNGCSVPTPAGGGRGGFGRGGPGAAPAFSRSAGRIEDGLDTQSNCTDFGLQTAAGLAAEAAAGANNLKVSSVAEFSAGQTVYLDTGENRETVVIAEVGTPGAAVTSAAAERGATVIAVAGPAGFSAGQTITVDSGPNRETAVIASVNGGRGGRGGGRGGAGGATITLSAPLTMAHASGIEIAGTGITLKGTLAKPHAAGAQVAGSIPTPGAPNHYTRRTQ